ncbi:winged helix DNA-binding domain-containing protein [Cellulomonas composti]|uniref:Winged helix DNA-binding domain-containing protein n=1 Tax=Cellulomonas composti TaxID=266130 RepID=A0A511JB74_9CELL|nr:winged helix DNA-binding domain-containing protein [Cellulomonas composti]GEL95039.1 hypothetical protein CCO02nite_16970 [Cellulomonas composti]
MEVARSRVAAQRLVGPPLASAPGVVEHLLAVQAQELGYARWSLAQRSGADLATVQTALDEGRVLRTHALRPTWHFLAADDVRWVQALTGPRVAAACRYQERTIGVDDELVARAGAVLTRVLAGGEHLTRDEVRIALAASGLDLAGAPLALVLLRCELDALLVSGVARGTRQTYALLDERVPGGRDLRGDDALVELVRRYLVGHGPATVADLSWWSSQTRTDLRRALADLAGEVERIEVDGLTLWHVPAPAPVPVPASPDVHLLQTYDEYVVGFSESRRFFNATAADIGPGNSNQFFHPVLLDSQVVAAWRPTTKGRTATVVVRPWVELEPATIAAIETQVHRWAACNDLDPVLELAPVTTAPPARPPARPA